jgi:hypothetical protein
MKPVRLHHPLQAARLLTLCAIALSVLTALLAARAWVVEPAPSADGRGLYLALALALSSLFGPKAVAVFWGALSLLLAAAARLVWRHAPKSPSDRLLW